MIGFKRNGMDFDLDYVEKLLEGGWIVILLLVYCVMILGSSFFGNKYRLKG